MITINVKITQKVIIYYMDKIKKKKKNTKALGIAPKSNRKITERHTRYPQRTNTWPLSSCLGTCPLIKIGEVKLTMMIIISNNLKWKYYMERRIACFYLFSENDITIHENLLWD